MWEERKKRYLKQKIPEFMHYCVNWCYFCFAINILGVFAFVSFAFNVGVLRFFFDRYCGVGLLQKSDYDILHFPLLGLIQKSITTQNCSRKIFIFIFYSSFFSQNPKSLMSKKNSQIHICSFYFTRTRTKNAVFLYRKVVI